MDSSPIPHRREGRSDRYAAEALFALCGFETS